MAGRKKEMRGPWYDDLIRIIVRPPFSDELGRKGFFEWVTRARPHIVRSIQLKIKGWPRCSRPLRIAFLSDFHTGSHSHDISRLESIVSEAQSRSPDLVLFGGDFVNMQPFGGGRVPPATIAAILSKLDAPCGRFAILGNGDYLYGEHEVADALRNHDIDVLTYRAQAIAFEDRTIEVVGLPDANIITAEGKGLLSRLRTDRPTIILAHDPAWFAHVPAGPYVTLAGHTHGGQVKLYGVGVLATCSKAPRRWTHGLVIEGGRYLYVTSGLGTSLLPIRIGVPPEYAVIEIEGV
jgi:predicted MPP superfamily phosphohydrolase